MITGSGPAAAIGVVTCVEYHTAGEPFRIVTAPEPTLAGRTVADRRLDAIADPGVNAIRRLLCHEPRGHADMYGCFPVPPDDVGADLGVLFWHKDGFSTACGHGTIALGVWASESGLVPTEAIQRTEVDGIPAIIPEVEGMAYRTGDHRFVLDPDDPLGPGFVLR